ncbi:MAG: J domain-containing protein [Lachnospiraceae bacterium]|jgi:molecular chaperone DnaJ|nr:J domain-containing protein [Lachnospiraceae bacterium]
MRKKMTDPYQVLGVSSSATDEEVKRAYREMSRKYHPDTYANNPLSDLAEEKFKEVQEAYKQIMDMRSGNQSGYSQGSQGYGGYQSGGQGGQGGYGGQQYNRQQYQYYGTNYGRNPYNTGGGGCGTGNLCCDLWCADTLCECMGGDLCTCF